MATTRSIRIKYILRNLGVPPHILGYIYSAEAINYMAAASDKALLINDIYIHVASVYSTSESCVEASIRNAVRKASKHRTALFKKLFGSDSKSVGNHMFLTTLRDIFEEENLEYISRCLESI